LEKVLLESRVLLRTLAVPDQISSEDDASDRFSDGDRLKSGGFPTDRRGPGAFGGHFVDGAGGGEQVRFFGDRVVSRRVGVCIRDDEDRRLDVMTGQRERGRG